jgi:hypothetical protein
VPDLFSAKPIIVTGCYTRAATGSLVIHGTRAGGEFTRTVQVDFPAESGNNAALEKIWARRKVDDLMSQDWLGIQQGNSKHKAEIIDVGLKHSLATQYTSFVAVEAMTVIQDGKPVRIEVPVELPQGVSPLAVPIEGNQVQNLPMAGSGYSNLALLSPGVVGGPVHKRAVAPPSAPGTTQTVEVTAEPKSLDTESAQIKHDLSPWLQTPTKPAGGEARDDKAVKDKATEKLLETKLSAELLTLYQCSQKRTATKGGPACNLPKSGNVEVEVKLSAGSAAIDQKLIAAGLKIKNGSGTTTISGEIAIAKLKALIEIAEVDSVTKLNEQAQYGWNWATT